MNAEDTNEGGYAASEMRKYLTTVEEDDGSGKFLVGLENAGVPRDVLWAPVRYISTKVTDTALTYLLWLPTEREVAGTKATSIAGETMGCAPAFCVRSTQP
jgi:hypothetical protein